MPAASTILWLACQSTAPSRSPRTSRSKWATHGFSSLVTIVVTTIVDTLTVGRQRGVSELLFGERDDDVRAAALFEQLVNENEITAIGG